MHSKNVKVKYEFSQDPKIASDFVENASRYKSEIFLEKDNRVYNAKSIISVLSIGAIEGDTLFIKGTGEDIEQAVMDLARYFI